MFVYLGCLTASLPFRRTEKAIGTRHGAHNTSSEQLVSNFTLVFTHNQYSSLWQPAANDLLYDDASFRCLLSLLVYGCQPSSA